ncbi:MAG: energy transducer TonB, partial [Bacteroidales bacterium]|nr:energy transducer TonB [Bacteroidales bacterium]
MKINIICFFLLFSCTLIYAQQSVNSQVVIEREAQFPGGESAMMRYIYENIRWPEHVKGITIDDIMMISLDVRADSLIENIVYLKKVGYSIDEQVVELLKRKKFIPSIQNGIPVKMNIILTIPIPVSYTHL